MQVSSHGVPAANSYAFATVECAPFGTAKAFADQIFEQVKLRATFCIIRPYLVFCMRMLIRYGRIKQLA